MSLVFYIGKIKAFREGSRPLVIMTSMVRMLAIEGTGLTTDKGEKGMMGAGIQNQSPLLCRKMWPVSPIWKPGRRGGN